MSPHATTIDYRAMVESAPDAIIVHNYERFLYVNPFAAERLGADADALVGQPIMQYVHPDSKELVVARLRRMAEVGEPGFPFEVRFVSRTGTVIQAEIASVPMTFGGESAILGLIRDVSRRTQAESALRESEERFANAFKFSPHGMALLGLDGRWLRANESLCRILGYSEDELREINFQTLTHPDDVAADREQLHRLVAGEASSYKRVKRYYRKDGRLIWVSVAVSTVHSSGGKTIYFIGQIQDITAQREMEEQNLRAHRLAGIAETTIAVAHEMNNALTVLTMNAELLVQHPTATEVPDIAAEILSASNRIAATVQRLTTIADPKSVDYVGDKKMLDLFSRTVDEESPPAK
jgi:PAS domain S-box-containing protein